ncbi:plasmid pRiA4b ORF-3 family protein [Pseudoneobacillus sp. C159]
MIIQCTKKLLIELKIAPSAVSEEAELFSWHANIMTMNRRKTVVLMNDSNRYILVLYSLKAKDFKNINELILQAITETFRLEEIKDEVIEAYISQSKEISFTTTKNKSLVARLNKACDHVYFFENDINPHSIHQPAIAKKASRLMVGDGKNYINPNEKLYRELEALVGGPIFNSEGFILHVKLLLENHQVSRKIAVPKRITFPGLHETLQIAFGWKDYHLHEFSIYDGPPIPLDEIGKWENRMPILNLVCNEEALSYDFGIPMKLETGENLIDYFPAEIIYRYDLSDDWQHHITLEKMIDNFEMNHPICLGGEGNTPPEDVGGEGGYEEFLAILADPSHPEHEFMKSWGTRQFYEEFDIESVNRRLQRV